MSSHVAHGELYQPALIAIGDAAGIGLASYA